MSQLESESNLDQRLQQPPSKDGFSRRTFIAIVVGTAVGTAAVRVVERSGFFDFLASLVEDLRMDPERDLTAYLQGKKARIARTYDDPKQEGTPENLNITRRFLQERANLTVEAIEQEKNFPFILKFDRDRDNALYKTRYVIAPGRDVDQYINIFDPNFLRDFGKHHHRLTAQRIRTNGFMIEREREIVDSLPTERVTTVVDPVLISREGFPPDSLLSIAHGSFPYFPVNEKFAYRVRLGSRQDSLNPNLTSGDYTLLVNEWSGLPPRFGWDEFDDPLRLVLLSPKTGEFFYNDVQLEELKIPLNTRND